MAAALDAKLDTLEKILDGSTETSMRAQLEAVGAAVGELAAERLARARPRRRASDVEPEVVVKRLPQDNYDEARPALPEAPRPPELKSLIDVRPSPPPPATKKILRVSPAKANSERHRNVVVLTEENEFLRRLV